MHIGVNFVTFILTSALCESSHVCSIRSKTEETSVPTQEAKSSSSKMDEPTTGLSVQFMSPTGSKSATGATDTARTSQRITNYTVASASTSSSATGRKDKDTKDIL